MATNRRMFVRPTDQDFASDEALEAFAHRVWLAFTSKEQDMTQEHQSAQTDKPKDVPRAGFSCGSYGPGHCVHYMPVTKLSRDRTPLPARLEVRGEALVLIVDGQDSTVWNHNPSAVRDIAESLGSACDWYPTLGLARWIDGDIRHWVNLSLEPVTSCESVEDVRRAELDAWR